MRYFKFIFLEICFLFLANIAVLNAQNVEPVKRYVIFFKRTQPILKTDTNIPRQEVIHQLKSEFAQSLKKASTYIGKSSNIDKLWSSNAIVVNLTKSQLAQALKDTNILTVSRADTLFTLNFTQNEPVFIKSRAAQWGVRQIGATKVWKNLKIKGSGIVVGCIDSGITANHSAFKGQIIAYKDFTNHGNSKKPTDGLGHGTHVAGIIAGKKSGIGVAPGAKLMIARIFDNKGRTTLEIMLKAMQWMLEPDKNNPNAAPRVVNSSWNSKSTNMKQFWNILNAWKAAEILPVFGAGNNGNMGGKVGSPANYPQSFAVGATQKKDKFFAISCQGPAVWDGVTYIKPDITAPGRDIMSASNKGGNIMKSGTSMAAPHVAGTVALMLEANPGLTESQIIKILKETAKDLGSPGPDNKFGYGRVDAYAAVKKAKEMFDFSKAAEYLNRFMKQEQSLTGDENNTCLSSPYAYYLVNLGRTMSEEEFIALYKKIKATGSQDAKELIWEIKKVRNFEKLQKNKN